MVPTRLRMVLWGACAVSVFYNTNLCGATRFFADGFENGFVNWNIEPRASSIDTTYAHSGACSHRSVFSPYPHPTIAILNFKHPASNKLFLRFHWLMKDVPEGFGKLGRFNAVSGGTAGMELWYDKSWTTGIFWSAAGTDLKGSFDGRWPGNKVSEQNVWHKYEVFIEYNVPVSAANGRLRLWIDRPDDLPFESANAYKPIDVQNCQFRNTAVPCVYEMLHLPTNYNNVGGATYFDDVELWDGLPDVLPPRPEDSPPPSAPKIQLDY